MAIVDGDDREILRRTGPAGLIDPRHPEACADTLIRFLRESADEAGIPLPATALCAGLAGAGARAQRRWIRDALATARVADRILVVPDGEVALEGALAGTPGVLLVSGTGSGAWGRGEGGRIARCGGWGMRVGDEGSGYDIGRAGLQAALRAADGRGEETALLPELLTTLELTEPEEIPAWAGGAEKREIAALAPEVVRLTAAGDPVAGRIVDAAADELARLVLTLIDRLGPWSGPVGVVFHGGVLQNDALAARVEARLLAGPTPIARRPAAADAVEGAVRMARSR